MDYKRKTKITLAWEKEKVSKIGWAILFASLGVIEIILVYFAISIYKTNLESLEKDIGQLAYDNYLDNIIFLILFFTPLVFYAFYFALLCVLKSDIWHRKTSIAIIILQFVIHIPFIVAMYFIVIRNNGYKHTNEIYCFYFPIIILLMAAIIFLGVFPLIQMSRNSLRIPWIILIASEFYMAIFPFIFNFLIAIITGSLSDWFGHP